MSTRYIFITGGVVSSLGKGLAAAALGALLQTRGYKVLLRKLDPYLNIDPGTLSPFEHGEVFVTDDGTEADLDLGHYERFTGVSAKSTDYVTTGKLYFNVLTKERKGDYLGATIQIVPHITNEIKQFITNDTEGVDFVLCEIGGTVGDIEGLPYYEAIRQLRNDLGRRQTMFIHLTLLPFISTAGELKTKPTQHSVKELLSVGIQADLLLCRSDRPLLEETRRKLAQFCNVPRENVIAALDADSIYQVPLQYQREGLDQQVCNHFNLTANNKPNLKHWRDLEQNIKSLTGTVKIGIVGKYTQLLDAYKSLNEALQHGALFHKVKLELEWIDSENRDFVQQKIKTVQGILVPGGFGERGIEGKIDAIRYARENNIPFLGICFGMQLAVIEACRNQLGLKAASSTEFGPTPEPVIGLLREWQSEEGSESRDENSDLGGTMRLGAYACKLKADSLAYRVYHQQSLIHERHRHRYEVNRRYLHSLEKVGVICSGLSPDGLLPEIIENNNHPWFIGVQFHPELKSRLFEPHPLFVDFIRIAKGMNIKGVEY